MPTGNRVNAPAAVEPETAVKPLVRNATPRPAIKAKLGQNFLSDKIAAGRIVDALGDLTGRTVLEIGPGRGVLTDILARRAARVIAIELDRVLSAQLRMRYATHSNLDGRAQKASTATRAKRCSSTIAIGSTTCKRRRRLPTSLANRTPRNNIASAPTR